MTTPRVLALISGANAEGIAGHVVRALVEDGVHVRFLDYGSTDRTVEEVEAAGGPGLIVDRLAPTGHDMSNDDVRLRVLARKEHLAQSVDADWILHGEADEFFESPWSGGLREAVGRVAREGYTAIAFRGFTFLPTTSDPTEDDVRLRQRHFDPQWTFDRDRVVCWKRTRHPVTLTLSGGQAVESADRRICPIRFVLRKYPFHADRVSPSTDASSSVAPARAPGWMLEEGGLGGGVRCAREASSLEAFDDERVRFHLLVHHREFERVDRLATVSQDEADRLTDEAVGIRGELRGSREQIAQAQAELAKSRGDLDAARAEAETLRRDAAERDAALGRVLRSRSWAITAPLRALDRLLRRSGT